MDVNQFVQKGMGSLYSGATVSDNYGSLINMSIFSNDGNYQQSSKSETIKIPLYTTMNKETAVLTSITFNTDVHAYHNDWGSHGSASLSYQIKTENGDILFSASPSSSGNLSNIVSHTYDLLGKTILEGCEYIIIEASGSADGYCENSPNKQSYMGSSLTGIRANYIKAID